MIDVDFLNNNRAGRAWPKFDFYYGGMPPWPNRRHLRIGVFGIFVFVNWGNYRFDKEPNFGGRNVINASAASTSASAQERKR